MAWCVQRIAPGCWFNIKMSSYQYRKSHCGDKTVVRSSYLHNGISYTGKMTSLYIDSAPWAPTDHADWPSCVSTSKGWYNGACVIAGDRGRISRTLVLKICHACTLTIVLVLEFEVNWLIHSCSVKVGNYTKMVSRNAKWKYIWEMDTFSLPGNILCPIVARTQPKTGFKSINKRCCHCKPHQNT